MVSPHAQHLWTRPKSHSPDMVVRVFRSALRVERLDDCTVRLSSHQNTFLGFGGGTVFVVGTLNDFRPAPRILVPRPRIGFNDGVLAMVAFLLPSITCHPHFG